MNGVKHGGCGVAIASFALLLGGCELAPTASPNVILGGGATDYGGPGGNDAGAAPEPDAGASVDAGPGFVSSPTVDEPAVLKAIARGAFRSSPAFVHVTRAAFPSAAAPGATVDEWVSTLGAGIYTAIAPDAGGASATLPVGTTIVREVLDATGAVSELTLLVKGPSGYNPAIDDWWWGVTDPQGAPVIVDGGGVELGKLTQCYSCHLPRQGQDFMFGAPADDRFDGAADASAVVAEH